MKLIKFRVTNFRSVEDSGWISADNVTAFIGINESGKSNLLIPLWKLNPAQGGEIKPVQDFPRSKYNQIRQLETKPVFINAHFSLPTELSRQIAALTKRPIEEVSVASVSRRLDGSYQVGFPNEGAAKHLPLKEVSSLFDQAKSELANLNPAIKAEDLLKEQILTAVTEALQKLEILEDVVNVADLDEINELLAAVNLDSAGARSTLKPRFSNLMDDVSALVNKLNEPAPHENTEAKKLIRAALPKFVYYSNYGNLDSEIYLPTVIQNMERDDLGAREEAKARTLKVLFNFVNISPKEISDLGRENATTPEHLEATSQKKTERDVLLQSAGTQLTRDFRLWWKQGDYRFRFAADGNFFRIWVSDDKRPEDIELENRSTGLQWFLSFFLVFLVEAQDSHANSILLLDEPGLTLHPLAQKDLSKFFDNLSETNQILYSTHSPFLVESDKLDRVKAVYMDENGKTVASSNLRASSPKSVQEKSIYAVHAALGLTVSDVILQGCLPVIVEGPSDQYYLSMMKNYVSSKHSFSSNGEVIFIPAGGAKGIKAILPIVSAKHTQLPVVLIDSDEQGLALAKNLISGMYSNDKDRIINVGDLLNLKLVEVEDLFESNLIAETFSRSYRSEDEEFSDIFDNSKPIVPQMESFADSHGLDLEDGWKVELAKTIRRRVNSNPELLKPDENLEKKWIQLFTNIVSEKD